MLKPSLELLERLGWLTALCTCSPIPGFLRKGGLRILRGRVEAAQPLGVPAGSFTMSPFYDAKQATVAQRGAATASASGGRSCKEAMAIVNLLQETENPSHLRPASCHPTLDTNRWWTKRLHCLPGLQYDHLKMGFSRMDISQQTGRRKYSTQNAYYHAICHSCKK